MFRRIWRIRVYESIFKFFSDLIPTWWIIKILFYKKICHIIIHKIFYKSQGVKFKFFLFFLFLTNPIDRATCENVIEKANTKVIVCFELKIFILTKKGGKERNFFQSDQDLVELDQSHLLSYICSNKTIPKTTINNK